VAVDSERMTKLVEGRGRHGIQKGGIQCAIVRVAYGLQRIQGDLGAGGE